MGSLLDDLEKINQIDQRGMLSVISSLPESAEDAIVLAENVKLKVQRRARSAYYTEKIPVP